METLSYCMDRLVSGMRFLTGAALECNRKHRRSVVVLLCCINIETLKHLLPKYYNTIKSNLLTESIQDQFLKDCTSKQVGPIVSYTIRCNPMHPLQALCSIWASAGHYSRINYAVSIKKIIIIVIIDNNLHYF